jgi:carboxyl-terminal processing protease
VSMSKSLLIILLSFLCLVSREQSRTNLPDSLKYYLDTVISLNKTKSIYRNTIDWKKIEPIIYAKASGATKVEDLFSAIRFLYDTLNDSHSYFTYKGKDIGKPYKEREINPYLINEIFGKHVGLQVKVLDNFYGYILIPTIEAQNDEQVNEFAQQIHDSLCSITPQKLKGWIIDLRFNQGGNMYAMLGGLGSIIGDGKVGFLTNAKQEVTAVWSIKNGNAYYNDKQMSKVEPNCRLASNLRIAVLISEMTASSGEAIAIILNKRPKTILIGNKTWGVSTGRLDYRINDFTSVGVTESYMADRNKTIYKNGINSDEPIIGGDNIEQLLLDKKVLKQLNGLSDLNNNNKAFVIFKLVIYRKNKKG